MPTGVYRRPSAEERALKFVDSRGPDECWPWTGDADKYGYGLVSTTTKGRRVREHATRTVYRAFIGPLETDQEVCHTCDNPWCVNPTHFFIGTHQENMRDMANKERHRATFVPGENNVKAKLTQEEVDHARAMYAARKWTQADLAQLFGVSRGTISHMLTGRTWKRRKG